MFKNDNQLDDFFGLSDPSGDGQKHKENLKDILLKKLSFWTKLRLAPKVLSFKERYVILGLLVVIVGSVLALPFTSFYHYTLAKPDYGGSLSEGILGEPRLLNPLLSQNNDADRDLTNIIYSSLMKYNEDGKLVPDLAKSYEISGDGLSYTVYLKDNAKWHDGTPFTADDVIFTIQTAQNPDYTSPQRVNWQGVDVLKVDDHTMIFKLKSKYAQFLNSFTIGILPKHLWQDVKPINFSLFELNLKPVGSGPFKFKKFRKDKLGRITSYELQANKDYYDDRPYIDSLEIKLYPSENELIDAYNKNEIENIGFISAKDIKKIKFKKRLSVQKVKLPRYFAIFLNQNQSKILSDKDMRLALNYATDKKDILKKVLDNNGLVVDSPLITGVLDSKTPPTKYDYDLDRAKGLLAKTGWTPDESGILVKKISSSDKSSKKKEETEKLALKLTTSTWPEFTEVANILKEQWKKAGIDLAVEALPISQLQQVIQDRDYQMLLFGEILNVDADPFSFWHSTQKRDPGQNLALYDNRTADNILDEARQILNPLDRAKKYNDFQKLVIEDVPAIFLYSPLYLYGMTKDIKGFDSSIISMPSDRFSNIAKWYINTKRVWKK